jgi:hypothetical protein
LGAVGEYVTARALGIFWPGPGKLRGPDAGPLQVRTRTKHTWDLFLHPEDDDAAAFVLVTGQGLIYQVHGWIYARDGKQQKWWREVVEDRPAFFVPQTALRSLGELRGLLRNEQLHAA